MARMLLTTITRGRGVVPDSARCNGVGHLLFQAYTNLRNETKRNETISSLYTGKEPAEQKLAYITILRNQNLHILLFCETKIRIYYYFAKPKLAQITIL